MTLTDDDREALIRLLDDFPDTYHQENPVEKKYLASFNPWRMRIFPMGQGKVKQFQEMKPLGVIKGTPDLSLTDVGSYVADFEHYTFAQAKEAGNVELSVGLAYDYVLGATLIMVSEGWRKAIDQLCPLVGHQRKHYMEVMKHAAILITNQATGFAQYIQYPEGQKFIFMGTEIVWDIYSRRQLQQAHDLVDQKGTKDGLLYLKEIRDTRLSF